MSKICSLFLWKCSHISTFFCKHVNYSQKFFTYLDICIYIFYYLRVNRVIMISAVWCIFIIGTHITLLVCLLVHISFISPSLLSFLLHNKATCSMKSPPSPEAITLKIISSSHLILPYPMLLPPSIQINYAPHSIICYFLTFLSDISISSIYIISEYR